MLAAEQLANALANTAWRFKFQDEAREPEDVLELHICTAAIVEQDEVVSFWPEGVLAACWESIGLALLDFKMS